MNRHQGTLAYLLLLFALLVGCGKGVADLQAEAQAALVKGEYASAESTAAQALGLGKADRPTAWALENIALEAQARGGKGAEAAATLERLAGEYAPQVNAALYLAIGSYVKDAGQTDAAIDILAAGDKRFPEQHDQFVAAIDEMKNTQELDPAEIEKLKSLGYL